MTTPDEAREALESALTMRDAEIRRLTAENASLRAVIAEAQEIVQAALTAALSPQQGEGT